MNQNAQRNLQRRKRQATRMSNREYFKKKKEAMNVSAAAKTKVGETGLRSAPSQTSSEMPRVGPAQIVDPTT